MPGLGEGQAGGTGTGTALHKGPLVAPDIPAPGVWGLFAPKVPFHSACRLTDWRRGEPKVGTCLGATIQGRDPPIPLGAPTPGVSQEHCWDAQQVPSGCLTTTIGALTSSHQDARCIHQDSVMPKGTSRQRFLVEHSFSRNTSASQAPWEGQEEA